MPVPYSLTFTGKQLHLDVFTNNEDDESVRILNYVLLTKFQRWMDHSDDENEMRISSNSLINNEEYCELYNNLKEKYGSKIEAIWKNESTDPKKYVYEDVAIATYLLTLWKEERRKKDLKNLQTFVDFGCGNGLLVYILAQEGHKGYGIDVRRRKIWNLFDPRVDLREQTWHPSDMFDVDWIIANHSDELSPWASVVAAKSSYNCRYFLLPCCAFEFSGAKFSKRVKDKSLYMSYISYLMHISKNVCGFGETLIDRLKIPSTKRICLIGDVRSYSSENQAAKCREIDEFVSKSCNDEFKPRNKIELVRNCTRAIYQKLIELSAQSHFDQLSCSFEPIRFYFSA